IPDSTRAWTHCASNSTLVLHSYSLYGGAVLLFIVPRPRLFKSRCAYRRPGILPRELRRNHGLASDGQRRRVGSIGASVSLTRGPRCASTRQRRSSRIVSWCFLAEWPPSGAHIHIVNVAG